MIKKLLNRINSILEDGEEVYVYDSLGNEYEMLSCDETEFGLLMEVIRFEGSSTIEIHNDNASSIKVRTNDAVFLSTDGDEFTLRRHSVESEEEDTEIGETTLEQIEQEFDFDSMPKFEEEDDSYDPYEDEEGIKTSDDY